MSDRTVSIRLLGPDVTRANVDETGAAMIRVLDALAENMGYPAGLFKQGPVRIACDNNDCKNQRPWDAEDEGWVRTADGHDYCPACVVAEPRRAA